MTKTPLKGADKPQEMAACIQSEHRNMTISVAFLGIILIAVMSAYLVFGDNNDAEDLRTLRTVFIIFRHGDRSPTELYPNDPYINHEWTGGLGALSEKGTLQMYNLGKNLHKRYYRLLPSNGLYTKDLMHVISSAAERCLMSASAMLAGFMPPLDNRQPLPIHWQPVPVNSIPRDRDMLLAQKRPCPKYDESFQRIIDNPPHELKVFIEKCASVFAHLSKHTGNNITTILDVELLYNTLEIEANAGLELPDWTEGVFPEKMLPIAERSLALPTETPFMKKIKGGMLFTDIIDKMLRKRSKRLSPERSIYLYSGHDVTLVNIMRAMHIIDQTAAKPDYSATLAFELHHSVTFENDFEVRLVYYFNSEDKFPKQLSIPNCENPCSLVALSRAYGTLIVANFEEVCQLV